MNLPDCKNMFLLIASFERQFPSTHSSFPLLPPLSSFFLHKPLYDCVWYNTKFHEVFPLAFISLVLLHFESIFS